MKIIFTIVFDIEKCGVEEKNEEFLFTNRKFYAAQKFTMNWYALHTSKTLIATKNEAEKGLSGFVNAGKVTQNEKFPAGFSDYIMLCARSTPMSG